MFMIYTAQNQFISAQIRLKHKVVVRDGCLFYAVKFSNHNYQITNFKSDFVYPFVVIYPVQYSIEPGKIKLQKVFTAKVYLRRPGSLFFPWHWG